MSEFRQSFLAEFSCAMMMILFGLLNIYQRETGLHVIISAYLVVGGAFLFALAVRRRRGGPFGELAEDASGLVKAIEKLSTSKPFGFTMLAVSPLPVGFGLAGLLVGLSLYLMSVNAMRASDDELRSWVFAKDQEAVVGDKQE